jgi:hypothetical protein
MRLSEVLVGTDAIRIETTWLGWFVPWMRSRGGVALCCLVVVSLLASACTAGHDAARARLVHNIVEHLKAGVELRILRAAVEYWKQVDANLGPGSPRVWACERPSPCFPQPSPSGHYGYFAGALSTSRSTSRRRTPPRHSDSRANLPQKG